MGQEIETTTESILLVDDQPANLQVLLQTLGSLGCKLLVAKSGEAALTIVQKARPDLILLDIMMPGIDGFEVCRRLKADPATEKIPIIFLSALDETADKVRGLQLGAVDYVAKPFQPEEVIARVNTHLTIHRLGREVQQQRDELEHELQVVSQLQRNLLPEHLPQVDGLKLAVHYETSRYAGGDYYDVAELPNGRLAILVADAEGHSAPGDGHDGHDLRPVSFVLDLPGRTGSAALLHQREPLQSEQGKLCHGDLRGLRPSSQIPHNRPRRPSTPHPLQVFRKNSDGNTLRGRVCHGLGPISAGSGY